MEQTQDWSWLDRLSPQPSFYQMCSNLSPSPSALSPLWHFTSGNDIEGPGGNQTREERVEQMELGFSLTSPRALVDQIGSSMPSSSPTPLSPLRNFSSGNNLQGSGVRKLVVTSQGPEYGNFVGAFFKALKGDDFALECFPPAVNFMSIHISPGFLSLKFASGIKRHRKRNIIAEVYVDEALCLEAPLPVIEALNDEREPYDGSIHQASGNSSMDKRPCCENEFRPPGETAINQACPTDDEKLCDHPLENSQKERNSKKKEKQLSIEHIQPLLSLKLEDAAAKLGVSKSTLKRKCRQFGIKHWPTNKRRAGNAIELKCTDVSTSCGKPNEGYVPNSTGYECIPSTLDTTNQCMPSSFSQFEVHEMNQSPPNTRLVIDGETSKTKQSESADNGLGQASGNLSSNTFIVKAEYKEDIIRLVLSTYSVVELKEQVQKRLNLEVGKFKIKYQDDDDDWLLMTCDSDLEHAVSVSALSGGKVTRWLILDVV